MKKNLIFVIASIVVAAALAVWVTINTLDINKMKEQGENRNDITRSDLDDLNDRLGVLERARDALQADLKRAKDSVEALTGMLAKDYASVSALEGAIAQAEARANQLEADILVLDTAIKTAKAGYEADIDGLKLGLSELGNELGVRLNEAIFEYAKEFPILISEFEKRLRGEYEEPYTDSLTSLFASIGQALEEFDLTLRGGYTGSMSDLFGTLNTALNSYRTAQAEDLENVAIAAENQVKALEEGLVADLEKAIAALALKTEKDLGDMEADLKAAITASIEDFNENKVQVWLKELKDYVIEQDDALDAKVDELETALRDAIEQLREDLNLALKTEVDALKDRLDVAESNITELWASVETMNVQLQTVSTWIKNFEKYFSEAWDWGFREGNSLIDWSGVGTWQGLESLFAPTGAGFVPTASLIQVAEPRVPNVSDILNGYWYVPLVGDPYYVPGILDNLYGYIYTDIGGNLIDENGDPSDVPVMFPGIVEDLYGQNEDLKGVITLKFEEVDGRLDKIQGWIDDFEDYFGELGNLIATLEDLDRVLNGYYNAEDDVYEPGLYDLLNGYWTGGMDGEGDYVMGIYARVTLLEGDLFGKWVFFGTGLDVPAGTIGSVFEDGYYLFEKGTDGKPTGNLVDADGDLIAQDGDNWYKIVSGGYFVDADGDRVVDFEGTWLKVHPDAVDLSDVYADWLLVDADGNAIFWDWLDGIPDGTREWFYDDEEAGWLPSSGPVAGDRVESAPAAVQWVTGAHPYAQFLEMELAGINAEIEAIKIELAKLNKELGDWILSLELLDSETAVRLALLEVANTFPSVAHETFAVATDWRPQNALIYNNLAADPNGDAIVNSGSWYGYQNKDGDWISIGLDGVSISWLQLDSDPTGQSGYFTEIEDLYVTEDGDIYTLADLEDAELDGEATGYAKVNVFRPSAVANRTNNKSVRLLATFQCGDVSVSQVFTVIIMDKSYVAVTFAIDYSVDRDPEGLDEPSGLDYDARGDHFSLYNPLLGSNYSPYGELCYEDYNDDFPNLAHGANTVFKTVYVKEGSRIDEPIAQPTKFGYAFVGWYVEQYEIVDDKFTPIECKFDKPYPWYFGTQLPNGYQWNFGDPLFRNNKNESLLAGDEIDNSAKRLSDRPAGYADKQSDKGINNVYAQYTTDAKGNRVLEGMFLVLMARWVETPYIAVWDKGGAYGDKAGNIDGDVDGTYLPDGRPGELYDVRNRKDIPYYEPGYVGEDGWVEPVYPRNFVTFKINKDKDYNDGGIEFDPKDESSYEGVYDPVTNCYNDNYNELFSLLDEIIATDRAGERTNYWLYLGEPGVDAPIPYPIPSDSNSTELRLAVIKAIELKIRDPRYIGAYNMYSPEWYGSDTSNKAFDIWLTVEDKNTPKVDEDFYSNILVKVDLLLDVCQEAEIIIPFVNSNKTMLGIRGIEAHYGTTGRTEETAYWYNKYEETKLRGSLLTGNRYDGFGLPVRGLRYIGSEGGGLPAYAYSANAEYNNFYDIYIAHNFRWDDPTKADYIDGLGNLDPRTNKYYPIANDMMPGSYLINEAAGVLDGRISYARVDYADLFTALDGLIARDNYKEDTIAVTDASINGYSFWVSYMGKSIQYRGTEAEKISLVQRLAANMEPGSYYDDFMDKYVVTLEVRQGAAVMAQVDIRFVVEQLPRIEINVELPDSDSAIDPRFDWGKYTRVYFDDADYESMNETTRYWQRGRDRGWVYDTNYVGLSALGEPNYLSQKDPNDNWIDPFKGSNPQSVKDFDYWAAYNYYDLIVNTSDGQISKDGYTAIKDILLNTRGYDTANLDITDAAYGGDGRLLFHFFDGTNWKVLDLKDVDYSLLPAYDGVPPISGLEPGWPPPYYMPWELYLENLYGFTIPAAGTLTVTDSLILAYYGDYSFINKSLQDAQEEYLAMLAELEEVNAKIKAIQDKIAILQSGSSTPGYGDIIDEYMASTGLAGILYTFARLAAYNNPNTLVVPWFNSQITQLETGGGLLGWILGLIPGTGGALNYVPGSKEYLNRYIELYEKVLLAGYLEYGYYEKNPGAVVSAFALDLISTPGTWRDYDSVNENPYCIYVTNGSYKTQPSIGDIDVLAVIRLDVRENPVIDVDLNITGVRNLSNTADAPGSEDGYYYGTWDTWVAPGIPWYGPGEGEKLPSCAEEFTWPYGGSDNATAYRHNGEINKVEVTVRQEWRDYDPTDYDNLWLMLGSVMEGSRNQYARNVSTVTDPVEYEYWWLADGAFTRTGDQLYIEFVSDHNKAVASKPEYGGDPAKRGRFVLGQNWGDQVYAITEILDKLPLSGEAYPWTTEDDYWMRIYIENEYDGIVVELWVKFNVEMTPRIVFNNYNLIDDTAAYPGYNGTTDGVASPDRAYKTSYPECDYVSPWGAAYDDHRFCKDCVYMYDSTEVNFIDLLIKQVEKIRTEEDLAHVLAMIDNLEAWDYDGSLIDFTVEVGFSPKTAYSDLVYTSLGTPGYMSGDGFGYAAADYGVNGQVLMDAYKGFNPADGLDVYGGMGTPPSDQLAFMKWKALGFDIVDNKLVIKISTVSVGARADDYNVYGVAADQAVVVYMALDIQLDPYIEFADVSGMSADYSDKYDALYSSQDYIDKYGSLDFTDAHGNPIGPIFYRSNDTTPGSGGLNAPDVAGVPVPVKRINLGIMSQDRFGDLVSEGINLEDDGLPFNKPNQSLSYFDELFSYLLNSYRDADIYDSFGDEITFPPFSPPLTKHPLDLAAKGIYNEDLWIQVTTLGISPATYDQFGYGDPERAYRDLYGLVQGLLGNAWAISQVMTDVGGIHYEIQLNLMGRPTYEATADVVLFTVVFELTLEKPEVYSPTDVVMGIIDRLSKPVTTAAESQDPIRRARELYENWIPPTQWNLITNLSKLEEFEGLLAQALITEALETVGEDDVTLADEAVIMAAYDYYYSLVHLAASPEVNAADLVALEGLKEDLDVLLIPINAVIGMIEALPATITTAHKPLVFGARDAFEDLSVAEQARVGTKLADLESAEVKLANAMFTVLPPSINLTNFASRKADVMEAKAYFDSLTAGQQAAVDALAAARLNNCWFTIQPFLNNEAATGFTTAMGVMLGFPDSGLSILDPSFIDVDTYQEEMEGEFGGLGYSYEDAILSAWDLYDNLSDGALALVASGLKTKIEALYAALQATYDDLAANDVIGMIEGLIAIMDVRELTLDDEGDVVAAREAFNRLVPSAKMLVLMASYFVDTDEFFYYNALLAAEEEILALNMIVVNNFINDYIVTLALGGLTLDDEGDVDTALAAFEDLSDAQKELVKAESYWVDTDEFFYYDDLLAAEAEIQALYDAVDAVDAMIAAIELKLGSIAWADKAQVVAAREAFDELLPNQQALVDEASLSDAELEIAALYKQITDLETEIAGLIDPSLVTLYPPDWGEYGKFYNAVMSFMALDEDQQADVDGDCVQKLSDLYNAYVTIGIIGVPTFP
ncbi:MAG: hypothetical protein FWD58_01640 [Firmicutes bacterium]|nr:hypothetical protein [Bacillota bacterium]